jgi:peptide/nickel transport system permease protein
MMSRYLLRRILQIPVLMAGIAVFTFCLIHLAPGDPVITLAGEYGNQAYYDQMHAKFGLDKPLHEQLFIYLGTLARGDLGYSYIKGQPVIKVILSRVPPTLLLMSTSVIFSTLLGITLGILAARRPNSPTDASVLTLSLLGNAIPVFWLAQMMIFFLAGRMGWFPIYGMTSAREQYTGMRLTMDIAHHLALPAAALTVQQLALVTRLTRAGMIENLARPYATAVRAKGANEPRLLLRHILRNALIPVVTILGGRIGFLFAGAALTETVFAWPGLGRLLLEATLTRDYPVLMGIFLLISLSVILFNLVTDLVYSILDPTIKFA